MDRRGPKVLHQHQLPFRGSRAGGDDQAADLLGAVMHDQSAGEQAVTHHVLEDILAGDAGADQRTRDEVGGIVHIIARKEQRLGFARRAAGGVQAHRLLARHRQQPVRVNRPQVRPRGEGQAARVGQGFDAPGRDAQLGELLLVERHALREALERCPAGA